MAQYTVKQSQNIFDIAIRLYGSIEGVFDLLISNPNLSMSTDLAPGQQLEYHEDFVINQSIVDEYNSTNNTPINGERHVYPKLPAHPFVTAAIVGIQPKTEHTSFIAAGEGTLLVDWGDNSVLEAINLQNEPKMYSHYFDNDVDERRIKFYGEPCQDVNCCEYHVPGHLKCTFTHLDISPLNGAIAVTRPLIVDKFVNHSNDFNLAGLFLFEGTHHVDIRNCTVNSLLPLVDLENLQELHIENVDFTPSVRVLDEYLQALVDTPSKTGRRIGCKVYMTKEPSSVGYEAIHTILNEPEWNEPIPWEFYINGQLYTISTDGTNAE